MKNKIIKIIVLFAIVLTIFGNYNVQAINNPLDNPDQYNPMGVREDDQAMEDMTETVLGVINIVGIIASVVVLMIMGIKYMLGSIEEKAEYKKSMTSYVIGAILLFAVPTIANILYNIAIKI